MKVAAVLIVCVCLFAVAYAQYYPQGVVVDPVPQQTVIVQGQPEQPRNMFGLPSVGAGLANIGETIANWGAGVLDTAGRILKK